MFENMKKIIRQPSASGQEKTLGEMIREIALPHCDSVAVDAMGNVIALRKGTGTAPKKIMLAAHIDEIGFIVNYIDDNGFIRVSPIGGINWTAVSYTKVLFENGTRGVIAPESGSAGENKPEKFIIDIGASNKKEAEKRVTIGDTAILDPSFERLCGKIWCGHPMDDKICAAILLDLLTADIESENDVYYVFTVQEEVGCRGSRTAAYAVAPDVALALDVTPTNDIPGCKYTAVKLGGGAAVKIKDSSVICDTGLVGHLRNLAETHKIKYQMEVLAAGGTDTSSIQSARSGCAAGCISMPNRYVHTGIEMISADDYNACIALVRAFLTTPLHF